MTREQRIEAFVRLGDTLHDYLIGRLPENQLFRNELETAVEKSVIQNAWFTPEGVVSALSAIRNWLKDDVLSAWISAYPSRPEGARLPRVGVVMAGNIPLVGFHDFLSVLLSGCRILIRLSASDRFLLPAFARILFHLNPSFRDLISFADKNLSDFDAVIATGSNNTSRYFEYYFGKYPHIIRRNRNSVALLFGNETRDELRGLADDMFMYFGLGCRNVSRLMVPQGYDFGPLTEACGRYSHYTSHHLYFSSYEYYRAVMLVDRRQFTDGGFFLLEKQSALAGGVSLYYYDTYSDASEALDFIREHANEIQCVVAQQGKFPGAVAPGFTQRPAVNDYADGVDTLAFLSELI